MNLPATKIDEDSEKNPNEISTYTSEDLEDETSINGKESKKKHMRESWNYLQTTERVLLSCYGKKTCEFLNQVGVAKVGTSFKKKCQSLATKKKITSMQKQNLQPQRPLQECKAEQQQKWGSTTNVCLL